MKIFLIAVILICSSQYLFAQELNCAVQVSSAQVAGSDKKVFETMQTALFEFMNNRKWTNNVFKNEERIECSILINISERSGDKFKGSLQVQSRRPIFKTSYPCPMINFIDKDIEFNYTESQSLDFADNTNLSNLTSLMAYYAYIVIGLDYDSFSMNGGQAYFDKAQNIVNNAQNVAEKGWKAFESQKNRYWLVENLLNQNYKAFREMHYKYHRLGMDILSEKPEQARNVITECIENLQKLKRDQPNLCYFAIFFSSKADELANIYTAAQPNDKTRILAILSEIDPANISKYKTITGSKF